MVYSTLKTWPGERVRCMCSLFIYVKDISSFTEQVDTPLLYLDCDICKSRCLTFKIDNFFSLKYVMTLGHWTSQFLNKRLFFFFFKTGINNSVCHNANFANVVKSRWIIQKICFDVSPLIFFPQWLEKAQQSCTFRLINYRLTANNRRYLIGLLISEVLNCNQIKNRLYYNMYHLQLYVVS